MGKALAWCFYGSWYQALFLDLLDFAPLVHQNCVRQLDSNYNFTPTLASLLPPEDSAKPSLFSSAFLFGKSNINTRPAGLRSSSPLCALYPVNAV